MEKTVLFDFQAENATFLMLYKKLVLNNFIFLLRTIIYTIIIEFFIIYSFFVFLAYYITFYDLLSKSYVRHIFNLIIYSIFLCIFFYINFILFFFFLKKYKNVFKLQINDFLKSLQIPITKSFTSIRKFVIWNIYIISNLISLLFLIYIFDYDFPFFLYSINNILDVTKNEYMINIDIFFPYSIPDFLFKKKYWWLCNDYFLNKLFIYSNEKDDLKKFKNLQNNLEKITTIEDPLERQTYKKKIIPYEKTLSLFEKNSIQDNEEVLPIPFQTIKTKIQYTRIMKIIINRIMIVYEKIDKNNENNKNINSFIEKIKNFLCEVDNEKLESQITTITNEFNKSNVDHNTDKKLSPILTDEKLLLILNFVKLCAKDKNIKFQKFTTKEEEIPAKNTMDTIYLMIMCLFIIICFIERSVNNRQNSIIIIFIDILLLYFIKDNNCLTVILLILNNIPLFLDKHDITFNNNYILSNKRKSIKFNTNSIILKDIRIYFSNKNNISKDILNIKLLNIEKPNHLLCGPSGAGKTMFLSLLLQLFCIYKNKGPICTGQYMIKSDKGYINMNEVDPSDFKKSIIYLPQFPDCPSGDFSYLLKSKNYIEILEMCEIKNIFINIGLKTKFSDIKETLSKDDIIKINLSQALVKLENEVNHLLVADETFDVISKQNFIKIRKRIKYYFIVTHIHQDEGENVITVNNNTVSVTKDFSIDNHHKGEENNE